MGSTISPIEQIGLDATSLLGPAFAEADELLKVTEEEFKIKKKILVVRLKS
jgi:hypothetical protein